MGFGADDDGATLENDPNEKWSRQIVVLDEILPHEYGCSHEIACHAGTVTIVSTDLDAVWVPADCSEQRVPEQRVPEETAHE